MKRLLHQTGGKMARKCGVTQIRLHISTLFTFYTRFIRFSLIHFRLFVSKSKLSPTEGFFLHRWLRF